MELDPPVHCMDNISLSSEPLIQNKISHAAAVNFMNHLCSRWAPPADPNSCDQIPLFCVESNCILLVKKHELGLISRYNSADVIDLIRLLKFPESEENQRIMKFVMWILSVTEISVEFVKECMSILIDTLEYVGVFSDQIVNHYLFESFAVLIRRACQSHSLMESYIDNCIERIYSNSSSNSRLWAYSLQLLALRVELNISGRLENLERYITCVFWNRPEDFPALVCLLQAYIQKLPHEISQQSRLTQVLGIVRMLVSSPNNDGLGFYLLNTVIYSLEYSVIAPYMAYIWSSLFMCLQKGGTPKFEKSFLIFTSLFLVKHGSANLVGTMNAVQPGIILAIADKFWVPNFKLITGAVETKLVVVASAMLICDAPVLLDADVADKLCMKLLENIDSLLSRPDDKHAMLDIEEEINMDYILYNARSKEEDPLKDIKDPREFLKASIVDSCAIYTNVELANKVALLQLQGLSISS